MASYNWLRMVIDKPTCISTSCCQSSCQENVTVYNFLVHKNSLTKLNKGKNTLLDLSQRKHFLLKQH
jgi:hypothetical protein